MPREHSPTPGELPGGPSATFRTGPPVGPTRGELGRAGETEAACFLEGRGYRIVARNVRADRVEIDLIARRGGLLVFVEVKSRRSLRMGAAAESVDRRKQQRLRRGATAWLASRPEAARGVRRLRFDVVTCLRLPMERPPLQDPAVSSETRNDATAPHPDGARWQIEHWEGAF